MKFISEKKITAFYLLAAIALVSILTIYYYNSRKEKATSDWVEHTQEVLDKNDNVLLDILNIETGSRGYLLTGNKSFLEPYNNGVDAINIDLPTLAELTKDNPDQQIRIDSLKKIVAERMALTNSIIKAREQNVLTETGEITTLEKGKIFSDSIRSLVAIINSNELGLLKQRKTANENSNKYSGLLFLMLIALAIVIMILVIIIISNQKINNKNQESIAHLANIVVYSDDAIISKSLNGKIESWNKGAEKMFGYTENEAIGKNISLIIPPEYMAEERNILQRVSNNEIIDHYETVRFKKNREQIHVSLTVSPLKDNAGRIIGISKIARNIAGQKLAIELLIANKELAFQNEEKEKRADELVIANEELVFQNDEKEKRAAELVIANEELAFQNDEKEKRADELVIANEELAFQNDEKVKRADELVIANEELIFQNDEKEKRAAELVIANEELAFQQEEKIKRAAELVVANYARSLIEASRDPLFTISKDGKITDMNKASIGVTGISREDLINTDFINYFTDPDKAKKGYQEVFSSGFVADYPLTIMDGKLTDVLFNGSVYKDDSGNVLGAVVVARDITEQKRIEKELTEAILFAELATSIAEEAKAKAESATHIAEDAVKAKQQFLSNMSHEIRTPMNAIIGFTKVVLKTELSAKQKEYLTAIKMSGDALIVLINDILDLAKVDAGKMIFEQTPFKMALSISAMLHLFEPKIEEKNLELVKEYDNRIPEVLLGDPVRLHQIILNLVSNAVKFTSKGKITVSVRLLNEDNEQASIEFSIKDTGIGIAENKIDSIFGNFQQATSGTSRLYGGTGLGLSIVKHLVEPQGGIVSVKSKINEGSEFRFTLSFKKTTEVAEAKSELLEPDTEIKYIKVLVVEDIALNQLLMKTLLDDFGFERDIASNGKIAIEKLQTKTYDIILMDLQMPEMNGFEATEYIRNKMNSKIPIIALTADVTTVDLAKCKAVGMNDYIAKPVDEKLLYSKIIGLVKKPSVINIQTEHKDELLKEPKCINLAYLIHRTKSDRELMMEMISLYLEQTPPLVIAMNKGYNDKDWKSLYAAVHKMIPSFAIVGINSDFENMAKKVQEYANTQLESDGILDLLFQIEKVCTQACIELKEELNLIKNTKA